MSDGRGRELCMELSQSSMDSSAKTYGELDRGPDRERVKQGAGSVAEHGSPTCGGTLS